jgi:outer membrane lipoprotein SlyB
MFSKAKTTVIAMCAMATLVTGCARQISSNVYSERHVGEASRSFRGIIVGVRDVQVEGKEKLDQNTAGIVGGGLVGGIAGNQFGGGTGNLAATAAGALGGAVAGAFIQKELEKQNAVEYSVELTNGEIRTIVQGPEPRLGVGQRVLVMISYEGRSRVVPDHTTSAVRP